MRKLSILCLLVLAACQQPNVTRYQCGRYEIDVDKTNDKATYHGMCSEIPMKHAESASGAKFLPDVTTQKTYLFWSKGDYGTFYVDGSPNACVVK